MSAPGSGGAARSRRYVEPLDRDVALSDGAVLRIREWAGSGAPLLLLHGFLGSRLSWGDLPSRLGAVHAVAVDLPGHGASGGGSTPEELAVPRVASLLAELQDRVFKGPAAWLGYSMGGRIALAAAVEGVPMARLLLESAGPGLATPAEREARRRVDRERADLLRGLGTEAFVDRWLRMPLFQGVSGLPPEVRARARAVRVGQDPDRMAAWLLGGGTGSQPDYRGRLPRLDLPVHLLVGEHDEKYRRLAREMLDALPRGVLTVAPGSGHVVHLEAPEAWVDWVRSSLLS